MSVVAKGNILSTKGKGRICSVRSALATKTIRGHTGDTDNWRRMVYIA